MNTPEGHGWVKWRQFVADTHLKWTEGKERQGGASAMKHYCPMCGEQWNDDRCGICGWYEPKSLGGAERTCDSTKDFSGVTHRCTKPQDHTGAHTSGSSSWQSCPHGGAVGACSWCDLRDAGGLPEANGEAAFPSQEQK